LSIEGYYQECEKDKLQNGRKYSQIMYFIKAWYPEYMKNSYNTTAKLKTEQRTWINIFPEKIRNWPTNTWKSVHQIKTTMNVLAFC
jgi:hypothetical protein